jgi:hypothetical protein
MGRENEAGQDVGALLGVPELLPRLSRQRRGLFLSDLAPPGFLCGIRDLHQEVGRASLPLSVCLGPGEVEFPDNGDSVARQQIKRDGLGYSAYRTSARRHGHAGCKNDPAAP